MTTNTSLVFQKTSFDIVDRNGDAWLRANQIGSALGYGKGGAQSEPTSEVTRKVRQLYERHADEFTDSMTALIKLPTAGGDQEVRIFSMRGAHLLAMFARTAIAKEFRRWVLDVLESIRKTGQYIAQPYVQNPGDKLTKAQADTLRQLLTDAVKKLPKEKQAGAMIQGWSKLKAHFKVGYRDIPQSEFTEAISLIARHVIEGEYLPAPDATVNSQISPKPSGYSFADIQAHMLRCMKLADAATEKFKESVFTDLVANHEVDIRHCRFLVCFTSDMKPAAQQIGRDAYIASPASFAKLIAEQDSMLSNEELANIAKSCNNRLAQRLSQADRARKAA